MSNYTAMKFIVQQMSGQEKTITIPRLYIDYLGNYPAAALLNQIVFWSDKSARADGFFFKSYDDWEEELGLSEKQVRLATTKMKNLGIVETKIKKANGSPTLHYKLHFEALCDALLTFGQVPILPKGSNETDQKEGSLVTDQRADSLTVDYTVDHTEENRTEEAPAASIPLIENQKTIQDVSAAYAQHITHNIGSFTMDTWKHWEEDAQGNLDLVVYAIERTAVRIPTDPPRSKERFVDMLIRTWNKEQITTVEAAQAYEEKPKSSGGASKSSVMDRLSQFAQKEG